MNSQTFSIYFLFLQLFFAILCPVFAQNGETGKKLSEKAPVVPENFVAYNRAFRETLFEYSMQNFSDSEYESAVNAVFAATESALNKKIRPAKFGKVALKIYTNSGGGLATPQALVDAVIKELNLRGYANKNIAIVDMRRHYLRQAGYLPKIGEVALGKPDNYKGCPVYDLASRKYYDKNWFYDNQMPAKVLRFADETEPFGVSEQTRRKSFLPVPLFLNVDFWINLPVITDMDSIGVSAALANASIWNMSNSERFFEATANAPVAVAEVMAIPELNESLLLNILSFQYGQVVGGAVFNNAYTACDRLLIASQNPCVVDAVAWEFLCTNRAKKGFPVSTEKPVMFEYCRQLEIGESDFSKIKFIPLNK